ncbi:MAG: hypothetical protein IKN63_00075 [Bacilli bacterium]|nr:hypothetical protein [Bacilli bacterium]
MGSVTIKCCESLNLNNIIKNDTENIFQTINLYDEVCISRNINKQKGILIKSNVELAEETKNNIQKLIDLFLNYVSITCDSLVVDIKKNKLNLLDNDYNILAGLLMGLNIYFKIYLPSHELIYLSKKIDELIAYYLICGYKKIDVNHRNYNIGENIYSKYFLFDNINSEELLKVEEFVSKNNLSYDESNKYPFLAVNYDFSFNALVSLKKEVEGIKIYDFKNTNENKILVKYSNYFE